MIYSQGREFLLAGQGANFPFNGSKCEDSVAALPTLRKHYPYVQKTPTGQCLEYYDKQNLRFYLLYTLRNVGNVATFFEKRGKDRGRQSTGSKRAAYYY